MGEEKGKRLYPHSDVSVGDILTIDPLGHVYASDTGKWVGKAQVAEFPHLFRPMPWWEHRNPEDMPEYLKLDIGYVKEVESYSSTEGLDYVYFQNDHCSYPLYMTIPATFKEYQEYKKQKP